MALIPEMEIDEFNATVNKGTMPCTEIVDENGDYIGTWIVPYRPAGLLRTIRTEAEYLGVRNNSRYRTPKPENTDSLACQYCGQICKSLAGKKAHERFCEKKLVEV